MRDPEKMESESMEAERKPRELDIDGIQKILPHRYPFRQSARL